MSTINDVAKMAGVSKATVSNIINNKIHVSTENYRKVLDAIDKLNFNPNFLASNLRSKKMKFIAVVMPNSGGVYGQMLEGIHRTLESKGYYVIIRLTNNNKYTEDRILDELINLGISGILLVTSNPDNERKFNTVLAKGIPLVFLERYVHGKDYTSVIFDNEQVVFDAVAEMLAGKEAAELSLEDLPLLVVDKELPTSDEDCIKGFLRACEALNLSGLDRIIRVGSNADSAFGDLNEIIPKLEKVPTKFIASNKAVAQSLLETLTINGSKATVYYGSGNCWCTYEQNGNLIELRRKAEELGEKGAEFMIDYIRSKVLFENKQLIVNNEKDKYENVYTGAKYAHKKIHLSMFNMPSVQYLLELSKDFTNNFGIEIEYELLNYADLNKKMQEITQKQSSDTDIIMLDYQLFNTNYVKSVFMELNPFIEQDNDGFLANFIPVVRNEFNNFRQKIYTLPLLATTQFLFYRRDLFDDPEQKWTFLKKNGFELRPPKTWTEYEIVAEFFTKEYNSQSPVTYGCSMQGRENSPVMHDFLIRQWACHGKMVINKNEIAIESIENKRALNSLCNSYKYSARENTKNWQDEVQRFTDGETAMMIHFATHIPVKHIKGTANTIMADTIPGSCPGLGGWTMGINAYSEKGEESYRFIKWALSNKVAVQSTLLGGFVPKNCVVNSALIKDCYPWVRVMPNNLGIAKKRETIRNTKGMVLDSYEMEEMLSPCIYDAMVGNLSVDEALAKMAEHLRRFIES